ncbi:MAG: PHB depolymerase family esterase [Gammaproteobacteria bacterium]|nr:PHB depolymerase family esterase [Gammaproteobacteria bacterium]
MSFYQSLSATLRRLADRFRWRRLAGAPLRGRLQAAWSAWRESRRKTLPNDTAHTFYARAYPGSRARRYLVHEPPGRVSDGPRPLVMVLHGCRQDNHDIERISNFNALADRHGFLVVYPFVTSYRGVRNRNCWGWWFEREIHAGAGEVEDLWQIVEEVCTAYAVDPDRIHVTGLSSGAGMAVAMMVAHADSIASGAAVAGVPYGEKAEAVVHAMNPEPRNRPVITIATEMRREMGEGGRTVPIQIVHSHDDDKVLIKSAEVLRDSWGYHFGIDLREAHRTRSGETAGTRWEHCQYRNGSGRSAIETLFLEGPGHGWYGGNPGNFSYPDAPDASAAIWEFFDAHPRR